MKPFFYVIHNLVVQCKCLTVTEDDVLTDYPIVSPGVTINNKCNKETCVTVATKVCVICNTLHCKQCSKVLLTVC